MALTRPPAWADIEQDEKFKALTPELKLQTFKNWSTDLENYGIPSGMFRSPVAQEKYATFLDSKTQEYESQISSEVGTLQGITNAAANAWDSSQQALKAVGGVSPEEAAEISKIEYDKQARSLAPGYRDYLDAQGLDAVKAFAVNPIEVTTNIVAEGLAGSVPALAAGLATGLAGAAVGAPTGIGAPVGFLGGQVAGTFAGSLATEYGGKILQELQEAGMDMTNPDSIVEFFSNEELVNAARKKGLARGIPVAIFDAVSAGIGGRVSSIVKAATKAPVGSVARNVAESGAVQALTKTPARLTATELGIQAGAGGLGEVAGSLVAGDPIEGKSVFAEILGEAGPAIAEIATGRISSGFSAEKAEAKAARDKKVSETLKTEQTLQENNAPLTAEALRNATVGSLKDDSEAQRLRELTLQGEQLPVAAPDVVVPKQYQNEELAKLTDEQLLAEGSKLSQALAQLQTTDPAILKFFADKGVDPKVSVPIAQAALQNARNEFVRRREQPAAPAVETAAAVTPTPAAAATPAPAPATLDEAVAYAERLETRGIIPAATPAPVGGVSFAPAEEREVPGLAAARPPATTFTPEEIEQQREATFGLPKKDTKNRVPGDPLRNLVEIGMGQFSASGVLKLLADSGVVPQGTTSLAQITDKENVIGWLRENGFDKMGGQTLPLFLREKRARGETLTPYSPAAGLPLFRAAEGAAPTPTAAAAVAPAPAVAGQPVPAPTPAAAPTAAPAPAVTEDPAFQRALARRELIRAEQENRSKIFERIRPKLGQASMGADPDLALAAVELAVSYAKEGVIRFTDWSARMRRDFPELWNELKDYLQDAWNTARAQVPELQPLEERTAALPLAPAPAGERPQVAITPAVPTPIPTAPTPAPAPASIEGGLPLTPAPEGERQQVQIVPPQRVEGVMPGGLVEYRQNLVQEARSTGVRTVRRSFEEIEADMKGKGWNGRKALKKFVRDVMDQANKDLQEGIVAPAQVIPDSKEEASVYEDTRKNNAVPSMGTIINRLAAATGRVLKGLKEARTQIRPDKETLGYISTLRSIQKNAETQLATDLGITNPETIRFTADLDDKMRIPNRVTTTVSNPGTLSNVEDLVVESPDPNATQEEIEGTILSNKTKIRAYLATLPNGSYEIKDVDGNALGTLTIKRPEIEQPSVVGSKIAKSLPQIQRLIDKKNELESQIRIIRARLRGDVGQPISQLSPSPVPETGWRWGGSTVNFEGNTGTVDTEPFVGPDGAQQVVVTFSKKNRRALPISELVVEKYNTRPLQGAPGMPGGIYRNTPAVNVVDLRNSLESLLKESAKIGERLNKFIDKTRQQVLEFAETATSPDPSPELLATPPSTEGSLADYATFTDVDGNEGLLFDAIEYLSGNLDTSFESVFVNDSEITARQLDQGRTLAIPVELRERVAPGITFDPETGAVTSAVSAINGGTRVSAPGQLQTAAKEAQTIMDTEFSPVPEEMVDLADIVQGIIRNPKTGTVVRTEQPLTKEQVAQIEFADGLISRYEANANVDEDRVIQIARVIFARAVRDGKSITPRRALDQAAKKLLERQKYRPKMLSTEAPVGGTENVFLGERLSVADIVEQFEGSQPEGFSEAGYADEPSLGRVEEGTRNMLDYDELVYRQVTLRHARLFAADPELNKGSEVYVKEHSREMLTLRRRLAKEGKLRGFTQEEISNFTMSILRDLDRKPLSARGLTDSRGFYSTDPDSVQRADTVASVEEKGRALRIIREVVGKFYPGIREVVVTNGKARMHVDPALERSLFANPEQIAEVIRGMDDDQATAFVRSLGLHEYYHLGLLRKVGVDGLKLIGNGLTEAQLNEAADIYFSRVNFATEADRKKAYASFINDPVYGKGRVAIEYLTMLAERMKNGQSIQEMSELTGLPKNVLQRILSAIKAIWRRLGTHVRVYRNPALQEKLNNLFDGVRELDQLAYGESVYPERNPEFREAPAEYSEQVGRIFESYKADTRKSYEVRLPGNPKTGTLAQNPGDAVRRVIARYIRDNGSVLINGRQVTNIEVANSEIAKQGSPIKFAKLTVPKAEQTLAKATAKPDANGQIVQGDFGFYSYSPDTRVRMGLLGQEKGGFWANLKAMFTGRYSETRSKTGGFGSSGKFAPDQRDVRIRQAAKINADVAKADFLVSKYKKVIKKVYKNEDIPIDLINTALGSTENKYTDDQYRQLQNAVDEDARAALVRQFMEQNLIQSKAKILDAQNQLPKELSSVLVEMRQNLIDLSNKLIAGGYLTEQMKMIVEANKEVYLHRSYQIFDNPEWKALMEKPEPGSEQERILNAADRLFRSKVQADIARDLRNEAAKSGVDMGVTRSLEIAARYKDDIAIKAHNMLIDYLSVADDRENNFLLTGTLPGQRKLDIIKVRGQIPKEIRELWGEIQNNETNFVKSVAKISAFMATTDTARDLLDLGIKQNYIWKKELSREPSPPAGFRPIYPPGTVSDTNPLKDAFAPQEVREAFRSLKDVNTMQGWAKWFSGLTAWSMVSKTIGNFPQGYVRNFLSNPLLVVNGGFVEGMDLLNPMQMMRNAKLAYRAALANTGLSFDEAIQAKRNEYISEGVVGDNVESSLFREMIETSMSEPGIPSLWQETKGKKNLKQQARMATGTAKRFFEKMADIYQGIDDFWKVFAYEQEKKFQKRTHPDWNEAKIRQEAATRVRNKLPTYSLSPEVTKTIRRVPFVAPFITWTSEIIRTGANTFAIAAEDIRVGRETNNKEMINNGMRSLKGALFSAALIPTAVATTKALFGYDEEDDEAIRQFVPDFEKNDQLLYIGERENGRASYLNLSYLDPQNMRAETAIAFYRAIRGESGVGEAFLDAATQMLQPLLSEQLFAGAVMDLARNRTTLGSPIWNEQDSSTNITLAKLSHLAKALSPGVITGVGTRVYRAATGQVTRQGRSYDLSNELAAAGFGQRVAEIDAQTMLGNKVKEFLSGRSEATQLLTGVLNSRGTIDIGDIPDAYRRANEAYVRLYEDMKKSYDSALLLGVPKQQAIRIISGAGTPRGLSEKDTLAIISGRFPQLRLSKPTLDVTLKATPDRAENLARRKAYLEAVQSYNTQN